MTPLLLSPHPAAAAEAAHPENCFDFLRFAAAMMVLVSHGFALVGQAEPHVFGNTLGALGVCVFFVTSGYLIFQSWQRDPHPGRFLTRRALRIFPALGVVVLFTALVVGPLVSSQPAAAYYAQTETYAYLSNFIFIGSRSLPGVFEDNPYPGTVNGGLWTLKYEFAMYLTVLTLGLLGSWRRPLLPLTLAVAAVASGAAAFLLALPVERIPAWLPGHDAYLAWFQAARGPILRFPELACYFLLGALSWQWRRLLPLRWSGVVVLAIVYGLAPPMATLPLAWAFVAYTALTLGNTRIPHLTRFGRLGDFSYGIYIYGFVVQQCVVSLLLPTPNWATAFVASFGTTLLLAVLSWNLVEAPALEAKNRYCAARA